MEMLELQRKIETIWWGLQTYDHIQNLQKKKVAQLAGRQQIEIWGLEFEPTVTLGLRANPDSDLKISQPTDLKIIRTDRGGQATLHSPGQLVVFPMIDLKSYKIGVQDFVETLFRTTQQTLKKYKVESHWKTSDPGVYTDRGKIAFCGLKIDSGVVRHGLSINISNDLSLFDSLVPCGNPSLAIDRLAEHSSGSEIKLESFFKEWNQCFHSEWKSFSFC